MCKGSNIFLIHFIRLGVLQKITEIANESEEVNQEDLIDGKITQKVNIFKLGKVMSLIDWLASCNGRSQSTSRLLT